MNSFVRKWFNFWLFNFHHCLSSIFFISWNSYQIWQKRGAANLNLLQIIFLGMGRFKKRFFEGEMGPPKKLGFLFSFWSAWPSALKEGADLRMAAYRRFLGLCLLIFHFSILLFFVWFLSSNSYQIWQKIYSKWGAAILAWGGGGVCYRINMSNTLHLVLDRGVGHLFMFFFIIN